METAPAIPPTASKTAPKDFFLWAGALIALYGSVIAFITLLFEYVNRAFPDPLAYAGDPYAGSVRFAMSTLLVLVPITIVLFRLIRGTIQQEPGKAGIWVRKWALVLTLFVAGVTIAIDLITLVNFFLMGETTARFLLKVAVVLLVAAGVFMHFLADLKGYWSAYPKRANLIGLGVGVVALLAIVAGFFIVGTPGEARLLRYDEQKVADLQTLQYHIINYYQQKQELPATLEDTLDPLSSYMPNMIDPQTNAPYVYEVTGELSFSLCATFNLETKDYSGQGAYPARDIAYPSVGGEANSTWKHEAGEVCFERTIDPDLYRPFPKAL